jgi:hypothetical protein
LCHFRTLLIQLLRGPLLRFTGRPFGHATDNPCGVELFVAAQTFNHVLNSLQRMLRQQLKHADVLPHARPRAVTSLQTLAELRKHPGQLPAAVDVRMIQRRRTTPQRDQIVQRIEHLVARLVTPPVAGNHTIAMHDVHAVGVAFHRDRPERIGPRHAVLNLITTHQLILVYLSGTHDARIKGVPGQSHGGRTVSLKELTNRTGGAVASSLPFRTATRQQVRVQLVEVLRLGHRRRPASLKRLDAVLHVRLLVAPGRHTEQRLEHVMTGQRGITRMEPPLPAAQQGQGHRLRVVPPHFSRHAAEVLEAPNHAFQNRFRTLRRQGHGKGSVRIRPHQNQHRYGPTALGEIDVDLPKIRFHSLPRIVDQRNERLPFPPAKLRHVTSHRVVAAPIPLGFQPLEDPHRRVTLLRRRLLIRRENLLDHAEKLSQPAVMLPLPLGIPLRLSVTPENLADLPPRMVKPPGDLANAQPIAIRPANPCIMIHRKHPILRKLPRPFQGGSLQSSLRWVQIQRRFSPAPGPLWTPISRWRFWNCERPVAGHESRRRTHSW